MAKCAILFLVSLGIIGCLGEAELPEEVLQCLQEVRSVAIAWDALEKNCEAYNDNKKDVNDCWDRAREADKEGMEMYARCEQALANLNSEQLEIAKAIIARIQDETNIHHELE